MYRYTHNIVYTFNKTLLVTNEKRTCLLKKNKRTKRKNCFGLCIHNFHNVECGMCCGADLPLSWLLHLLVSLCTTVRMMNFIDVLIVVWQRPNADVDSDAGSLIHDDCLPHSHGTYRCDIYTIYDAIRYDAMRCDAITI